MTRGRWIALAIVSVVVCGAAGASCRQRKGRARGTAAPAGPAPRGCRREARFQRLLGLAARAGGPALGATVFDAKRFAPFKPGGEALSTSREPAIRVTTSRAPSACRRVSRRTCSARIPVQIVQRPGWLVMVHEFMRMTRLIPLDGRPHRDVEPDLPWRSGRPLGRRHAGGREQELQALVARRLLLQDATKYRMHSDAVTMIERMRRTEAQHHQLRADDRRPEDLHAAVVADVRDDPPSRMGEGGALRVHVRREQPVSGRECRESSEGRTLGKKAKAKG